jgi:tetratricopeptide (TPR) repeat protein
MRISTDIKAVTRHCRRVTSLLACVILAITTGFAAEISTGFDSANKLYEQGKFADAASAYEKLVQSGPVSSALYFNLGNAYFKSSQLGHAIAAYHQAEKLSPRDPEVRANLQFVRGQVQGPTLSSTGLQRGLASLTLNEWATLAAVLFWLSLSLLVVTQFRPAWKQPLRNFLVLSGAATLVVGACLAATWVNNSTPAAIVVSHDALIRNGPLDEAPGNLTIHDGAEVSILDSKSDWLQVRVDGNRIGWVKRDQVVLTSGV